MSGSNDGWEGQAPAGGGWEGTAPGNTSAAPQQPSGYSRWSGYGSGPSHYADHLGLVGEGMDALNHYLGRPTGLAERAIIKGGTSLATLPADAGIGSVNMAARAGGGQTQLGTNASDIVDKALDYLGTPRPETTGEQVASGAMELGTAFGGNALSGLGSAAKAAPPALQQAAASVGNWWKAANADRGVNQAIYNAAWLRELGENGVKLTGDVLQSIDDRLSKVYNFIRSPDRTYAIMPGDIENKIAEINEQFTPATNEVLNSNALKILQGKVDTAKDTMQKGQQTYSLVTGEDLGRVSSRLGAAAKAAVEGEKPNYDAAQGLWAAKAHLDSIIDSGLTPAEQAMHAQANHQFSTLWGKIMPQKAGNVNLSTGDIDPFAVGRGLQKTDTMGLAGRNTSDAYEATRLAGLQAGKETMGATNPLKDAVMSRSIIKTGLKAVGPDWLQYMKQVGLPGGLKFLQSQPATLADMAQQMKAEDPNIQPQ